jgi:hypothetical protein
VSFEPASDASKDASILTVIWFQEELVPIISPENEPQLKAIPWERLAADVEW